MSGRRSTSSAAGATSRRPPARRASRAAARARGRRRACDGAEHVELLVAADQRRREPGDAARARLLDRGPREPCRHRLGLALRVDVGRALVLDRRCSSRTASARRRAPCRGSACCCRRAATLTASPLTISSPRAAASRPATTSPVLTPMRRPTSAPWRSRTRSANAPNRAWTASAARTARSGSSSCACGIAEHGQDRVADELLGRPAVSLDLAVDELEELALELADLLGVEPLGECRRAREVGEEDGDDAALLPVVRDRPPRRAPRRSAVPQLEQNASVAGCSAPQPGHVT